MFVALRPASILSVSEPDSVEIAGVVLFDLQEFQKTLVMCFLTMKQ